MNGRRRLLLAGTVLTAVATAIAIPALLSGSNNHRPIVLVEPTSDPTASSIASDETFPTVSPSATSDTTADQPTGPQERATTPVESPTPEQLYDPTEAWPAYVSSDGRYVAFTYYLDDLVAGDTNQAADVFIRDRVTHRTTLVSRSTSGEPLDGASRIVAFSGNGRVVAYWSGPDKSFSDQPGAPVYTYVNNLDTQQIVRLTEPDGDGMLSEDGRFMAFDTDNGTRVVERDLKLGVDQMVSVSSTGEPSNGLSLPQSISSDGRYVAFESTGTNLVDNDTNGDHGDLFVHDMATGASQLVSRAENGAQFPLGGEGVMSSDATTVAYRNYSGYSETHWQPCDDSAASLFVLTLNTGHMVRSPIGGCEMTYSLSGDGSRAAIQTVGSGWVWEVASGTTHRYSHCPDGARAGTTAWGEQRFSSSSRFIASSTYCALVSSDQNKLPDAYVFDLENDSVERASVPDGQ